MSSALRRAEREVTPGTRARANIRERARRATRSARARAHIRDRTKANTRDVRASASDWEIALARAIGKVVADVARAAEGANAGDSSARARDLPGPSEDCAFELAIDAIGFLERVRMRYGDCVSVRVANALVVVASGADVARIVLGARAEERFEKRGTAFFPGSSLTGEGLLTSDGDVWRRQRRLSAPAFRSAAVETYASVMADSARAMIDERWSARGERDVYEDFNDVTLEIVARALFGADFEGKRKDKINRAIKECFEFFGRRAATGMIVPEWVPTFDNVMFNAAVKRLDEEVFGIIAERRKRAARGEENERMDLLDRLLRAKDEGENESVGDGFGMTDKALRDELMTLMVAGQETSAILLSWACALVAEHPSAGDRIAEEARAALKTKTSPRAMLDASDFSKLPYTEACVLETLRIRPPAYMVGRCASKDVELRPGVLVKKGTTVLVAPYLIQRDPKYWNDPVAFKPERWLVPSPFSDGSLARDALKNLGPNDAYFPFGGGARVCIGTGFAMLESVLLLAMVCQACELRLPANASPPKPKALITLRPEPFKLEIRPRPRKV